MSPRAHDDNVLLKFFRNGMSLRFGWPSLSILSGKDIHDILMTDVDNFTGDMSIDEAFGAALKRTQTYMSAGICVAESSPAEDYMDIKWKPKTPHEAPPAKGILALYNRGDRHQWYWPCVECKEYFRVEPGLGLFRLPPEEELRDRLLIEDTLQMAKKYSVIFCPNCNVGIEHKHKKSMNAAGRWVGDGQTINSDGTLNGERIQSRTASYWLGGKAAAYQSWESLIERWFQAYKSFVTTGDEKAIKTTTNVDQAMPHIPMAVRSATNSDDLQDRIEDWPAETVPPGVRFLTAQVDVQANRFQILVTGWGPAPGNSMQYWIVDYYSLKTSGRLDPKTNQPLPLDPPKYLEDWDRLIGKVIGRYYALDDRSGRQMPVRYVAIDWGGKAGTSVNALKFWRSLVAPGHHNRVRLVKGGTKLDAALCQETRPDARGKRDRHSGAVGDVPQLLLNVNRLKDTVSSNIARATVGPGYYHFPRWLPSSFYEELTAETRTPKGWQNLANRRNEAFDLCVYAEGLGLWAKLSTINWQSPPPWADEWEQNSDIIDIGSSGQPAAQATIPDTPLRRTGGWISKRGGWIRGGR
jgi:phage terminase large subunit GpA-like protein